MNITLPPPLEVVIRRILEEVYVKWLAQRPVDTLFYTQRENAGFSVDTRLHKGGRTWAEFLSTIEPAMHQLETELENHEPKLLSFVYTSMTRFKLRGQFWLRDWISYLDSSPAPILSAKIDALIVDLKVALAAGAKQTTTIVVVGLSLPESIGDIRLELHNGKEAWLHRMTDEEFSKAHSSDPLFHRFTSGMTFFLPDTVLLFEEPANLSIRPTGNEALSNDNDVARSEATSRIVQALTLTKPGHFLTTTTSTRIEPPVVPAMHGVYFGQGQLPTGRVELLPAEIEALKVNLSLLLDGRPEIAIAAKRLVDAEARLNPADAVVDVAIGLETLLLREHQELTYRVKLNYAFLAPLQERRARVSELNELYKWRGKIVHGSAGNADRAELHNAASRGKIALRYAIQQFLRDPALRKDAKLDNEYWIDRIVGG